MTETTAAAPIPLEERSLSPRDHLAVLAREDPAGLEAALDALSDDEMAALEEEAWEWIARPEQLAPEGVWLVWLVLAGRGFGKTRTGAEWVKARIEWLLGQPDVLDAARPAQPLVRIALVAQTLEDVRLTMVEGESGLQAVIPDEWLPRGWDRAWNRGPCELRLEVEGHRVFLKGYSSERPGRLRGPQHHAAWVDEPAELKDAPKGTRDDTTWSNLLFGLRLGPDPRVVVTGTPKNVALIKDLLADGDTVATRGTTYDNEANLAPTFRAQVIGRYEHTRLGRQELLGEVLEDLGDIFHWGWFNLTSERAGDGWVRIRWWDLAATEPGDGNDDPDWTAGALVAYQPDQVRLRIEHVERFRLGPGRTMDRVLQVAQADGLGRFGIPQDPGQAGKDQVTSWQRAAAPLGLQVLSDRPTGDKETRAGVWAGMAERDLVEVVEGVWLADFRDEVLEFPNGPHDDQIDAVSSAAAFLLGRRGTGRVEGHNPSGRRVGPGRQGGMGGPGGGRRIPKAGTQRRRGL